MAETYTPTNYRDAARRVANEAGIPFNIFDALIAGESSYIASAVGALGEIGLGQLMPGTAAELGVDAFDPVQNLTGSARYLKQFYSQYGNWRDALAAYKGGPGNRATPGALSAADKVLAAAGASNTAAATGNAPRANVAWEWSNPWPWLKARAFDIVVIVAGVVLMFVAVLMLTKTGGAFVDGVRKGAGDALAGRA